MPKRLPTIEGRSLVRKQQEIISAITGKPIEGPFGKPISKPIEPFGVEFPHHQIISGTRGKIGDILPTARSSGQVSRSFPGKSPVTHSQARQNRAPYPLSKIKGIGK